MGMWMMERLSGLMLCSRACDSCSFPPMLDWSFTPSTLLSHSHFILLQHLKVGLQTWGEVIVIVSMIRSYITRKMKLKPSISQLATFLLKNKKKKRLHVFFRPSNQWTTLIINAEKWILEQQCGLQQERWLPLFSATRERSQHKRLTAQQSVCGLSRTLGNDGQ